MRRYKPIFLDLVEQRAIADAEEACGSFAVPVRLFERVRDGIAFGFAFRISHQQLQRRLFFSGGLSIFPVAMCVALAMSIAVTIAMSIAGRRMWMRHEFFNGGRFIAKYQEALYEHLQFTQIAGPGIALAGLE